VQKHDRYQGPTVPVDPSLKSW